MGRTKTAPKTRWSYWIDHLIAQRVSGTVTSDKQLAARSGLSPASLSNLKSEPNPTVGKLQKVADALGVDVSALLLPTPSEVSHAPSPPAALRAIDFSADIAPAVRHELIHLLSDILSSLDPGAPTGYDQARGDDSGDRPASAGLALAPGNSRR